MAQEIADSKLLDTWGSGGTKIEPDITKIIEGWQLGEQPPHEYMNWLQNTFGSKLNHILKNGVASWNNETEYLAGASVQHSGNVWICETTNTNSEPTGLNANWEKVAINKDLTVTVDTLDDLRSISYPANTVWASGYHAKNDGAFGSHIFRLKGVKTTETDNGGTVIIATIGSVDYVYELQYDGAVNVKWFGAKGDGASDGSEFNHDDTFSIQAALDYTNSIGNGNPYGAFYGGEVHFPKGNYTISNTIILYPNSILSGEGIYLTEIQARPNSPTTDWVMLDLPDRGLSGTEKINRNVEIKNISINGNDYSGNYSSNIVGLVIQRAIYSKLTNMEIKQCDSHGLKIKNGSSNLFISNSLFRDSNSTQIVIEDSTAIFFNGGEIRTGHAFGVLFENTISQNINFSGVGFVNSRHGGIRITNSSKNILVNGCSFINGGHETYTDSAAIRCEDSDSRGIMVTNNLFYLIYGKAIFFRGKESQIANNSIQGCGCDGIYCDGGSDIEIRNNTIFDSGYYADNTYKAIYCDNSNSNIVGNTIKSRNFTNKPSHALSLGASAKNIKITGNDISGPDYTTNYLEANATATYQTIDNKGLMDDVFFSVKFKADENVVHNVAEILDFDKVEFDIGSNWNYIGSNNAYFVAPSKGIYEFNLAVEVSKNTNTIFSYCYVFITNELGVEQVRYSGYISNTSNSSTTDERNTYSVVCMAKMEAGWRAYAKGYIDSDNDVTVDAKSFFQGKKVR